LTGLGAFIKGSPRKKYTVVGALREIRWPKKCTQDAKIDEKFLQVIEKLVKEINRMFMKGISNGWHTYFE
jgi:hypothetical protein